MLANLPALTLVWLADVETNGRSRDSRRKYDGERGRGRGGGREGAMGSGNSPRTGERQLLFMQQIVMIMKSQ